MDQYIGKLLDNRYEIIERIGTGGMAVVYKGRDHRLNRLVAVKILKEELAQDAEFRRRFHDESQAVAMLSHPNIMAVYDVSHSTELDYIVMELIDGITLKQYMQKKGGKLAWREALMDLPRHELLDLPETIIRMPEGEKQVTDHLDVTQGKLAMGFRTGIDAWDEDYPALMLLNAVYGGTTTSKLFLNVRERLSLCYYASSGLMKYKDVMLVSSGVEFSKVGQAQDEILAQLQACKDGGFTDDELEWARRSVVSTLMTTLDAQSRLEDYWLGQAAAGLTEAPDELAQRVERTTRAQVQAAAQKLTLDTVYFLKGKE
mgnify:CR=1 FL=1